MKSKELVSRFRVLNVIVGIIWSMFNLNYAVTNGYDRFFVISIVVFVVLNIIYVDMLLKLYGMYFSLLEIVVVVLGFTVSAPFVVILDLLIDWVQGKRVILFIDEQQPVVHRLPILPKAGENIPYRGKLYDVVSEAQIQNDGGVYVVLTKRPLINTK